MRLGGAQKDDQKVDLGLSHWVAQPPVLHVALSRRCPVGVDKNTFGRHIVFIFGSWGKEFYARLLVRWKWGQIPRTKTLVPWTPPSPTEIHKPPYLNLLWEIPVGAE